MRGLLCNGLQERWFWAALPGDSDVSGGGGWWAADEEGPAEGQVLKWDVAATLMRPCLPICPSPSLLAQPDAAVAKWPAGASGGTREKLTSVSAAWLVHMVFSFTASYFIVSFYFIYLITKL